MRRLSETAVTSKMNVRTVVSTQRKYSCGALSTVSSITSSAPLTPAPIPTKTYPHSNCSEQQRNNHTNAEHQMHAGTRGCPRAHTQVPICTLLGACLLNDASEIYQSDNRYRPLFNQSCNPCRHNRTDTHQHTLSTFPNPFLSIHPPLITLSHAHPHYHDMYEIQYANTSCVLTEDAPVIHCMQTLETFQTRRSNPYIDDHTDTY